MIILIRVVLPIVLAIISAIATIKVAEITSRNASKKEDQPAPTIAPAPSPTERAAGNFGTFALGATRFSPKETGLLMVSATGSANAGGTFRSYLDLTIKVDGKPVGQSRSYVPVNWDIGHIVNASGIVPVTVGNEISIELLAGGEGLKGGVALN